MLGGGLSVVAVRGEAALGPQAHLTAPYRPCVGRLGTPVAECTYSAPEHPEGIKLRCLHPGPTPCLALGRAGGPGDVCPVVKDCRTVSITRKGTVGCCRQHRVTSRC